jgi:nucleotide-binding universal stress UspA family protein
MFKNLLIPLDGSKLAESVLPAAASLAETLSAPVLLLHVIEQGVSGEVHHDRHLIDPNEAKEYLDNLARSAFSKSVKVETHIHKASLGDVPTSIIAHATQEFEVGLIILCSHGKGGVRNLLFGSIAQLVAAAGDTPVLLIKPEGASSPFEIRNILVPLDNESIHDLALPYAEMLSRAYQAQIDLLCVIPTLATDSGTHAAVGSMLPTTAAAYLEIAEEIAKEHFQAHLDEYFKVGIPASAEIIRGDPAAVIAKTGEVLSSDLILLGTHGKAGMAAFWNRSVTARIAKMTSIPLLLIPLANRNLPKK